MVRSHSLGFLVHDIARLIRADFAARPESRQITQTQWRTLAYLARMEGCRQNELAAVLEVRPITLGRLLDRLEGAGLVERRPDPLDRRAVRLHLTARARARVERLRAVAGITYERALRGLSGAERARLLELLARVRTNLGAEVSETAGAARVEHDAV
jgi:DNA-binding MarR family transcriptional regulator